MRRLWFLLGGCVAALALVAAAPGAAVAPAAPEDSTFLCYSAYQVDPGVWPVSQAQILYTTFGYWQPFAVKGNVTGGTNVGAYHLTCNLLPGSVFALHRASTPG